MTDPRAVFDAVRRAWVAADGRSATELTTATRELERAHREIRQRAEQQARQWGPSARALGRPPAREVDEVEIRSEEEQQRHDTHQHTLARAVRRASATGEGLLRDAFQVATTPRRTPTAPAVPAVPAAPEPDAYLPRSVRDRARRRADEDAES